MLRTRRTTDPKDPLHKIEPGTIAVLQLGKLGDMLLTLPLFRALRRRYPGARIVAIAAASSHDILTTQGAADEIIDLPRGILRQVPLVSTRLRTARYDLYIDVKDHRSTTSRLLAELIGAARIIAHSSAIKGNPAAATLPPADPPFHYVDRMLAPMKLLAPGVRFERRPVLTIPKDAYRAVDDRLDPGEHGIVTMNISAGDRSRYWEPAKWKQLITEVARQYSVVLISSPADRALADEICTMRKHARPVRTESILEAAAVVDRSLAVVTPDTSIVHIASARNRPCVGLYPPSLTNAASFAPMSNRHRVLMPHENETIASISVEEVLKGLREVMA